MTRTATVCVLEVVAILRIVTHGQVCLKEYLVSGIVVALLDNLGVVGV